MHIQLDFEKYRPSQILVTVLLFPDLLPKFRTRIRLIGSFGLQSSVQWIKDLSEALCPVCKAEVEDNIRFLFNCNSLMNEWDTFWVKLYEKIERVCTSETKTFRLFIGNLDQVTKLSFLVGGLELAWRIVETSRRYTAVSMHKILGIRARMITHSRNKKQVYSLVWVRWVACLITVLALTYNSDVCKKIISVGEGLSSFTTWRYRRVT